MKLIAKPALYLAGGLALSGCSIVGSTPGLGPPLVGLEGVSIITTDKTFTDHIVSMTSGKNCSTIRREQGRTYCEEDEGGEPEEVFCYPTLGKVTCYAEPQPYGNKAQAVGHTPPGSRPPR